MKNLKTWKIAYTIVDGEHEYGDYLLHEAGRLTKAEVAAVMAVFWCGDCGPEEEARFLRELTDDGYAALPSCGRCITGLRWEASRRSPSPSITASSRTLPACPRGITLQVRDLDDDDRDGQGQLVPWVSLWEGPRSVWPRRPAGQ